MCDNGERTYFVIIDLRTGKVVENNPFLVQDNISGHVTQEDIGNRTPQQIIEYKYRRELDLVQKHKKTSGCLIFLAFFGAATLVASAKCLGYF